MTKKEYLDLLNEATETEDRLDKHFSKKLLSNKIYFVVSVCCTDEAKIVSKKEIIELWKKELE
jgi:hypothetical protein